MGLVEAHGQRLDVLKILLPNVSSDIDRKELRAKTIRKEREGLEKRDGEDDGDESPDAGIDGKEAVDHADSPVDHPSLLVCVHVLGHFVAGKDARSAFVEFIPSALYLGIRDGGGMGSYAKKLKKVRSLSRDNAQREHLHLRGEGKPQGRDEGKEEEAPVGTL